MFPLGHNGLSALRNFGFILLNALCPTHFHLGELGLHANESFMSKSQAMLIQNGDFTTKPDCSNDGHCIHSSKEKTASQNKRKKKSKILGNFDIQVR